MNWEWEYVVLAEPTFSCRKSSPVQVKNSLNRSYVTVCNPALSVYLQHLCTPLLPNTEQMETISLTCTADKVTVDKNLSLCYCAFLDLVPSHIGTWSVYIMLAGGSREKTEKAFVIKIIQITWEGSHGYNIQSPLSVHIWRDLCVSTSSSCLNAVLSDSCSVGGSWPREVTTLHKLDGFESQPPFHN